MWNILLLFIIACGFTGYTFWHGVELELKEPSKYECQLEILRADIEVYKSITGTAPEKLEDLTQPITSIKAKDKQYHHEILEVDRPGFDFGLDKEGILINKITKDNFTYKLNADGTGTISIMDRKKNIHEVCFK